MFYSPTVSQQLIWVDQLLSKSSSKYNIGGYARLQGTLCYPDFYSAIEQVLATQTVYGSLFSANSRGELQVEVVPHEGAGIQLMDFSTEDAGQTAAEDWMAFDFAQAFDLEAGQPLFRFVLLKISDTEHYWYAKIHHIISDGWSFRLLLNQAAAFYTALRRKESLPFTSLDYALFAADDAAYYAGKEMENDRSFWLDMYKTLPAPLFQRQQQAGGASHSHTFFLSSAAREALERVASDRKVSLFQLIVSVLLAYFARVCQQSAVAVGVPVLNRGKKSYREVAGVFMNLLALKFEVDTDQTMDQLVKQVKSLMSAALRHQRYQYGNLVKTLKVPQGKPLYDIRISYEDFDFTDSFDALKASATALSNHDETDKLAVYLRDYHDQGFDVRFIYDTNFLDDTTIQQLCESLEYMLTPDFLAQDQPLSALQLMPDTRLQQLKEIACGPVVKRPGQGFLPAWRKAVATSPSAVAVGTPQSTFTYESIDTAARSVAAKLLSCHGNTSGRVAVMLPRNEHMITGLLGSMMAGFTYIPVDPSTPLARVQTMLNDADCRLLLTTTALQARLTGAFENETVVVIDDNPLPPLPAEQLPAANTHSYILYTSGTTGKPKGVIISAGALEDYICTFREYFDLAAGDVVLQQASLGFDTSVEEIYPVLAGGGRLQILEDTRDVQALLDALEQYQVTLLSTSPFVLRLLNGQRLPASLRVLISGGDVLGATDVDQLLTQVAVYNTYGPTESTVCATYHRVNPGEQDIPIGRPITNRAVYILDKAMHLQPSGMEGEICLAGEGLAVGYVNDAAATAARFVNVPSLGDIRVYRTGDKGISLPGGNIRFRGRGDYQLSYRGYRIEAQEVELLISRQAGVGQCAVAVRTVHDAPVLIGYVVYTNGNSYTVAQWQQQLQPYLPAYMIPGVWMELEALPVTANGKIDRDALPIPAGSVFNTGGTDYVAPRTAMESRLAAIWEQLLHADAIGIHDSFFEKGGHSLNVMQLSNQYYQVFGIRIPLKTFFEHPTIAAQVALLEAPSYKQEGYTAIPQLPVAADYPVSDGQQRLWIMSQLEGGALAYLLSGTRWLEGTQDAACLETAIRLVIQRYEILRTVFRETTDGSLRQVVLDTMPFRLDVQDFSDSGEVTLRAYLYEALHADVSLQTGPLLGAGLLKAGSERYCFYFYMHHIISDGWSMEILRREVFEAYTALRAGHAPEWPVLPIQYKDFAGWRQQLLGTAAMAEQEVYWRKKLEAPLPVLQLPAAHARPAVLTYHGERLGMLIGKDQVALLEGCCQTVQASLFMGLLAVLKTLFYRYTGQEDIIVGSPVSGRDHPDLEAQIGFYVNTIPLRTVFEGSQSFTDLLKKIRTVTLEAFSHSQYPLDALQDLEGGQHDLSRSAIFDVMMVLQNQQQSHLTFGTSLPGQVVEEGCFGAKYELVIDFQPQEQGLWMQLEFNTAIYDKPAMVRLMQHFNRLLEVAATHAATALHTLDYLLPAEKTQLLETLNATAVALPDDITVIDLFAAQVKRSPQATAVVCGEETLTYAALDEQSSRLANYLREQQVGPGVLVPVCLYRSTQLIVGILAVLKAGGAYVPVDPAYPQARIAFMLEDARAAIALCDHRTSPMLEHTGVALINLEDETADWHTATVKLQVSGPEPSSLMYVIYTSGSTGRPKGAGVYHRSAVNLWQWYSRTFKMDAQDSHLIISSIGFDLTQKNIFGALLCGGLLVLPSTDYYDTTLILDTICRHRVSIINCAPSAFYPLAAAGDYAALESMRLCILGGEPIQLARLLSWLEAPDCRCEVVNSYGPTECTDIAAYYRVQDPRAYLQRSIPIGMPNDNVQLYILNAQLQLQPVGVSGELYIAGTGVGAGYVNDATLTAARFLPNPFGPGRLYRTGDLCRRLEDGNIEYLGRIDEQVKFRGYRIELAEIEQVLLQQPGIAAAVVMVKQKGEEQLLAAFIIAECPLQPTTLRRTLQARLPEFMVPACFVTLEQLPLTPNGKIDRKALDAIPLDAALEAVAGDYCAPRTPTEERLVALLGEVLQRPALSVTDNFFDLGISSLQMVRIRAQVQQQFLLALTIGELHQLASIAQLAETIDAANWVTQQPVTEDTPVIII